MLTFTSKMMKMMVLGKGWGIMVPAEVVDVYDKQKKKAFHGISRLFVKNGKLFTYVLS